MGTERECAWLSSVVITVACVEIIEQISYHLWISVLLSSALCSSYLYIERVFYDGLLQDLPCKLWTVPSSQRHGIDRVYIMEGTAKHVVQPFFKVQFMYNDEWWIMNKDLQLLVCGIHTSCFSALTLVRETDGAFRCLVLLQDWQWWSIMANGTCLTHTCCIVFPFPPFQKVSDWLVGVGVQHPADMHAAR